MPKKSVQDANDRVVSLVENRLPAENLSLREACQVIAPDLVFPKILLDRVGTPMLRQENIAKRFNHHS